jgi:hypothetical protein
MSMRNLIYGVTCLLAIAGCHDQQGLCVQTAACSMNAAWDPGKCACVPLATDDAGGCVQTVACSDSARWDATRCECVVEPLDGGAHDARFCVDNVLCIRGAHWDPTACQCVLNPDMAESCSTSCAGGTTGCDRCSPACAQGELCCAWAGGACIPDDAGGCSASGGFHCATPTAEGLCPNQCYP